MDFSAALNGAKGKPGHPLRVNTLLDEFDGDTKELLAALHDPAMPAGQIARALNALGYDISEQAIRNWRRKNA